MTSGPDDSKEIGTGEEPVAGTNSEIGDKGDNMIELRREFFAGEERTGDRRSKADSGEEDDMSAMIEQLCESKADEFRLIGYEHVSGRDIWECVSDKYHKSGMPPLYQVVNDILSLKVTQFMNYITLNMYRGDTSR